MLPEGSMRSCVKPKVQWRTQKVGEARNVDPGKKAAKSEHSQPKTELLRVTTTSSAAGTELLKPFGLDILSQVVLRAGHGTTGFNICPAGFLCCLFPFLSNPPPYLCLMEWECLLRAIINWEHLTSFSF